MALVHSSHWKGTSVLRHSEHLQHSGTWKVLGRYGTLGTRALRYTDTWALRQLKSTWGLRHWGTRGTQALYLANSSNNGSVIDDVLLFSSTSFFILLNHMTEASVSQWTHLFNFQIWLLLQCSGGGFKYSLCRNVVFLSIDLRFQLLVVMVDSNVLKVSFDAVDDSLSKVFRLCSSKPRGTIRAFGFDLLSVCFTKQTQRTEIHFWCWFSTVS